MKLFVGNLHYEFAEDELKEIFTKIGEVSSAKIIVNHDTGRSRGFGFVEMASKKDGKAAIEQLNDSDVGDRKIVVKEAHERR